MSGIIFVRIKPGYEKEVMDKILGIENVSRVYRVFGDYDLIVVTQDISLEELKKVMEKIRSITYVLSTSTLVVVSKKIKKQVGSKN
ncbi:Lrp/AsnC family transcriptional regulator [Staphylothermus hellenicus]|uniref:Transcriptional regulator, AsnC family n=1 Tax=Staphylothermus hellenicus (strain DSM 12710 / JCM 10830 / BK20S6-10-b1 / P8) TaxID=591019 RepID=D7DC43_STAHD|nr:Lrp/AsnC ligand binding domain-containing protein [Staphylothermus hellenicus]ADI31740.1 transcriptional regulator, AsnC family [Staphylothermus hellenicus DSM 12710]